MMTAMLALLFILLTGDGNRTTVAADEVRTVVERYLQSQLPADGSREFVFRSLPSDLTVPAGELTVRVAATQPLARKGYVGIPVEVLCNGAVQRTILCSVLIRTFEDVYVVLRSLGKEEMLDASVVAVQRIETTEMDDAVTAATPLTGLRTKRMLNERSVLRRSALELLPAVRRDQPVSLLVRSGAVTVGAAGIAKQDGAVGEEVLVLRNGAKEAVRGRIVGQQLIEIDVR